MTICITRASDDLMSRLKGANSGLTGHCFENCVVAVLGFTKTWQFDYILGLVTPPGYKPVPHAWLLEERDDGAVYFDPTLQDESPLWRTRHEEFVYDERFRLTRDDLWTWFRCKYAGREFDDIGFPKGLVRGPIITVDGIME